MGAGGQYTSKTVPTSKDSAVGFSTGSPCDWTTHTAKLWGLQTTFTRSVENEIVTVATDCDDPTMMLLARKGDAEYWNGDTWRRDHKTRRLWSADIARRMLEEGLIATKNSDGIRTAMRAASSSSIAQVWHPYREDMDMMHVLTVAVAQLRGLRLIQSMNDPERLPTLLLGAHSIQVDDALLLDRFYTTVGVYKQLQRPPWEPGGVPWGPQPVAGHATTVDDVAVFVGEHGDLVWRA